LRSFQNEAKLGAPKDVPKATTGSSEVNVENPTLESQKRIFSELYAAHADSPMATSSETAEHKRLRFDLLTDLVKADDCFSIHDVGMGLADLYAFMKEKFSNRSFVYSGTEIISEFVEEVSRRFPEIRVFNRDIAQEAPVETYDWVVLSGVFHQRRESTIPEWEAFAGELLKNCFSMANKGIAWNFISPFVDFYQTDVYYSNMSKWIQFIRDNLSRFFALRHDYPLFEYTVYVYQESYVKEMHTQVEFQKYFKVAP
jgi:hypothetical protein